MARDASPPDRTPVIPVLARGEVRLRTLHGDGARLVHAIGTGAALRVLSRFGGSAVDLTGDVATGPVADLIGADAAQAMLAAFGPRALDADLDSLRGAAGRRSRGLWLLANDAPGMGVARQCDVHMRTARYWRAALNRLPAEDLAQLRQGNSR